MMNSDTLITLVHSKPEIWDQTHMSYTSKSLKVQAWKFIADKLGVTTEVAKARWTNLRDLFRRELKKTLRIVEETGDPNAHKPRWKHFKSLLFLKDQMIKDDSANSVQFDESCSLYPQTILEDGDGIKLEDDNFGEEESNSTPSNSEAILPSSSRKRDKNSNEDQFLPSSKRHNWEDRSNGVLTFGSYDDYSSRSYNEMDEDYHFVMSILPSVRRVRQDRKINFKMKVLQLIMDEEKVDKT
ncbi:UNVERIFIED_CONTAM: Adf1 [Trichonephila clavipes]